MQDTLKRQMISIITIIIISDDIIWGEDLWRGGGLLMMLGSIVTFIVQVIKGHVNLTSNTITPPPPHSI